MTLLHTFNLPNHKLYIYDTIDTNTIERNHISATPSTQQCYCPGISCDTTPCHFYVAGGNCVETISNFIRSELIPIKPELFI